jgi:apolipoprotein N-acyltransferase
VNAAIAPDDKWDNVHGSINAHTLLTDRIVASRPSIIVWPETAIPAPLDVPGALPIRAMSLSRRVREVWGAPLLVGVPEHATATAFHNVATLIDGERATVVYRKRRMVPFGETSVGHFGRVLPGPELVAGGGVSAPIVIDGAKLGVLICFEDLFADDAIARAREAEVLVVLTNDAWLGASGAEQHLAISTMRAIESGRSIIRAANRGVTTVLDPHGRMVGSPTRAAGAIIADAPRASATTLFARSPDALPFAAWAFALLSLAGSLSGRRRELAKVDRLL